jgi:hypothetical protein
MMQPRFTFAAMGIAALCTTILGTSVRMVTATTFTIDSNLSTITLSGVVAAATITQQSAGSLTDRFGGTVDVTYNGTTLTFNSANADALLNPSSPFSPPDGTGGSTGVEDNYGIRAPIIPVILVADGAIRDLAFSIASGAIPLVGSTFDATQLNVTTTAGVVDYAAGSLGSGFLPMAGETGANQAAPGVFVLGPGGLATLTIPFSYSQPFDVLDTDSDPTTNDSVLNLTGQLVATAIVPEPSSWMLIAMGGAALVCRRRRK